MNIYIPSSGRARDQHTLTQIPGEWRRNTAIVCPTDQYVEYCGYNPEATVIQHPHQGISRVRQFCLAASYPEPFIMMDDDLTFFCRRKDDRSKFCDATPGDIIDMLDTIEEQLRYNAHVGICSREGGNRYPDSLYYNVRIMRVLGYDSIILSTQSIKFDEMEVMEDFHVALSLLTKGYPNLMLSDWCHNQVGSDTKGGCSDWRTPEVQKRNALKLKENFPDFVSVVKKTTKTAWKGQERTDVRVQWKKAYASSQ